MRFSTLLSYFYFRRVLSETLSLACVVAGSVSVFTVVALKQSKLGRRVMQEAKLLQRRR